MHLAKNKDRFVSSSEISEKENIPLSFNRRILQTLAKEEIISSKEGIDGGVKLYADAKNINMVKLMEMFQGKVELSECMLRKNECPNRTKCVLRKRVKVIENKVLSEFKNITVERLVKDMEVG
jgi:Rrf2 family transcriptional regulator, cysteine metabolism repressor